MWLTHKKIYFNYFFVETFCNRYITNLSFIIYIFVVFFTFVIIITYFFVEIFCNYFFVEVFRNYVDYIFVNFFIKVFNNQINNFFIEILCNFYKYINFFDVFIAFYTMFDQSRYEIYINYFIIEVFNRYFNYCFVEIIFYYAKLLQYVQVFEKVNASTRNHFIFQVNWLQCNQLNANEKACRFQLTISINLNSWFGIWFEQAIRQ